MVGCIVYASGYQTSSKASDYSMASSYCTTQQGISSTKWYKIIRLKTMS